MVFFRIELALAVIKGFVLPSTSPPRKTRGRNQWKLEKYLPNQGNLIKISLDLDSVSLPGYMPPVGPALRYDWPIGGGQTGPVKKILRLPNFGNIYLF